ncbi:MAG: DsbA family protein [Patescibacteria group bacterium]
MYEHTPLKHVPHKYGAGLTIAIILAAILVSGSLIFLGLQLAKNGGLSDKDLQVKIAEGIDVYIKNEQQKAVQAQEEKNKPKYVKGDFADNDAFLGEKDAPVTIVEFSDYQCPYCANFFSETMPEIREKYINTGKVKFVYRDFPLSFHKDAYPAALLAECVRDQAGDIAYFKMHDKIFQTLSGGFDYDALSKYAVDLGVNGSGLKTCFDSDKFKDEIAKDQADGNAVGIDGTPGFIVNGLVVAGAQPFSYFEKIIEAELAKTK